MNRDKDGLVGAHDKDMDIKDQTSNELDLNVESCRSPKFANVNASQSNFSSANETNVDGVLKIGTKFESDDHAYRFYNKYATLLGFNVRKDWVNRSKIHGQVVSRKFTCSKEGYRRKDKRDINVKKPRRETRTGCMAHMIITRQSDGIYKITHFEAQHNHNIRNPSNAQILLLQKELCASGTDLPDDLGTHSKSSFEQMNRRSGLRESLDYLSVYCDNYIRFERTRNAKEGEVSRLLHYFQRQHFENPSFFYAVQLDIDDKVTNIFWADDNMVADYNYFGDVVCLDTSCRTNKDFHPFVEFIGVNHHNQVLIFAAALLFDDTVESLKWLFHTFLGAMSGKKPRVILTEQDAAIVEAINSVLPETDHRICLWQMSQNALKHLGPVVKEDESFANDFRSCIYDHKDEESFIGAWNSMLDSYGLQRNEWLRWMFREKEKWAVVYGRNTFFIDMKSSHMGESLSNMLRSYLKSDEELLQFFKHFERVVDELRFRESEANDEMSRCMPRLMGNVILLKHASDVYTPKAFEVFQREYERCLNVVVNHCCHNGSLSEYKVNIFGQTREYTVTFNSSDDTVICSCMKFECVGFLCCHALKVLDHRNIKVTPSRYILKRWTKDARTGSLTEHSEFNGREEDPKLVTARRYKALCQGILNLSVRAAESEKAFQFASRQLNEVIEGLEKILTLRPEGQGITTSSNGANGSETENPEVFLAGTAIEDQNEGNIALGVKQMEVVLPDRCRMKHMSIRGSKKRIQNVQPHLPSPMTCISNPQPPYISSQSPAPNTVMQGLYNFENNEVVQCMYQQPDLVVDQQPNLVEDQQRNLVMHQQPSTDMHPQPNFYSEEQDSHSQTPLMQVMDLDIPHPHSSSFLLYDDQYRTSDNSYLRPK